jgi:hypothetical protein
MLLLHNNVYEREMKRRQDKESAIIERAAALEAKKRKREEQDAINAERKAARIEKKTKQEAEKARLKQLREQKKADKIAKAQGH